MKKNKTKQKCSYRVNYLNFEFLFFVCFYQNKISDLYKKRPKKLTTTGIQDFLLQMKKKIA